MAIRMMTSKERFEAGEPNIVKVSDYPGHAEGVISHSANCPHYAEAKGGYYKGEEMRPEGLYEDCVKEHSDPRSYEALPKACAGTCRGPCGALYMETTHIGLVLDANGERNYHDDSDFYATVWNPEKGCPEQIEFATTRGWTYPNSAWVDATPEVLAAYSAWGERVRKAAEERRKAEALAKEVAAAKEPRKGRRVKVVKGRKVPLGFEGIVIWEGVDNWGKARIGIKNEMSGKVEFTAASNAEVVEWQHWLRSDHPEAGR